MRLTILKKGLLLIAVPLCFQLVFIFVLNRTIADADVAEQMVIHSKDVLVMAESAFAEMVRAQSAGRGFVLTAHPAFDAEAKAELELGLATFVRLEEKVRDNPAQTAAAQEIIVAGRTLSAWISETLSLVRSGRREEATARILALEGKQRMDALRARLDEFTQRETLLEKQRLGQLQAARESQQWTLGVGVFGATLVTCFVAWVFSTGVSRRLLIATRNAEALAENRSLAERVRGGDEVARLDEVMHQTARRLAESVEAEKRFQSELQKRATELAAANESLRQQTQENEMFVYSVSHDLRSPLVNLQGFSQELGHAGADLRKALADERVPADIRVRVDRTLEDDVGSSIRFIRSAVTRAAAIIDALLRLSRAGRVEYRLQQVDVAGGVARIVEAMSDTIDSKNAKIEVGTLPPCWGDPTAVEQIFGNLIGNAVNYLDPARPGRIEVGISNVSSADQPAMNTYHVRDNGLGIPAPYVDKIFVAFQRLHGDVAKGEGIGLALVRQVVERHGGSIRVESTEGVGTTFFLTLPADDPAKIVSPEHDSSPR